MKRMQVFRRVIAWVFCIGLFFTLAWVAAPAFEDYSSNMIIGANREAVTSVDFSPDGSTIVAGYIDGSLTFWDVASGKPIQTYSPEIVPINSVRYSPDGQWVAWGTDDGMVKLWIVRLGQVKYAMRGHAGAVRKVAFSPNGNQIASAGTKVIVNTQGSKVSIPADPVRLWLVLTGEFITSIPGHRYGAMSVTYSNNGAILATGGALEGEVIMWNALDRAPMAQFFAHGTHVLDMKFSRDDTLFATSSADFTVKLYEIKRGQIKQKKVLQHPYAVPSISFSPDGSQIACACYDQKIHIWDTCRGREDKVLSGHIGNIESVCYSPDGRFIASGGFDKTVKLWDAKTGQCLMTYLKSRIPGR